MQVRGVGYRVVVLAVAVQGGWVYLLVQDLLLERVPWSARFIMLPALHYRLHPFLERLQMQLRNLRSCQQRGGTVDLEY